MKFELLGRELEISDGMKNHMKILYDYLELSEKAVAKFADSFEKSFSWTFLSDSYIEKFDEEYGSEKIERFIYPYVTETRKYLAQYDVYTLTDEEIWRTVFNGSTALSGSIISLIMEMISNDLNKYEQRKCIEDAFKTGRFSDGLRKDIIKLCDYVLEYLDDNNIIEIEFVTATNAEKAAALYKNLRDSNIPEEKRAEIAFLLISLDPRYYGHYKYIFEKLPSAKYEITNIARYLSVDISDLIERDLKASFDLKKIRNEEDAIEMMAELKESMRQFGVSKSAKEKELRKVLSDYDIKAKTYDNVLYKTRAECAQAKKDDEKLTKIYGDIHSIDKDDCRAFLSQIEEMQCTVAVKNKHLELLKNRIDTIDKEYLNKMLSDLSLCNEADCNKIKEQIAQYDASEDTKESFISQIEQRIYRIWEEEEYENFKEIYMKTPVDDRELIGQSIGIIMDTGRTKVKDDFLVALYQISEADVVSAAKYIMAKDSGSIATFINMGKKDSYNALTLDGKIIHPAISAKVEELKAEKANGFFSGMKKSLFSRFGSKK